jgi:hypothetical protein
MNIVIYGNRLSDKWRQLGLTFKYHWTPNTSLTYEEMETLIGGKKTLLIYNEVVAESIAEIEKYYNLELGTIFLHTYNANEFDELRLEEINGCYIRRIYNPHGTFCVITDRPFKKEMIQSGDVVAYISCDNLVSSGNERYICVKKTSPQMSYSHVIILVIIIIIITIVANWKVKIIDDY